MSTISKSVCDICRRENVKLFLKGDRCYSEKCSYDRRPYPPGQHGQSRLKFSEYALQLREKQKTKRYYGVSESQFRKYFKMADRSKGVTGEVLLQLLERRLDNVIYTLGYASSRREARQLVSHGHYLINGKPVNIPSYIVKIGDEIQVKPKSSEMNKIAISLQGVTRREIPDWLQADHGSFKGTIKDNPTREMVSLPVEENMIVEYYSR